jgi:hypothetical protein
MLPPTCCNSVNYVVRCTKCRNLETWEDEGQLAEPALDLCQS